MILFTFIVTWMFCCLTELKCMDDETALISTLFPFQCKIDYFADAAWWFFLLHIWLCLYSILIPQFFFSNMLQLSSSCYIDAHPKAYNDARLKQQKVKIGYSSSNYLGIMCCLLCVYVRENLASEGDELEVFVCSPHSPSKILFNQI